MKAIPLLVVCAAISALDLSAAAQDIVSTVQLTQQSMDNTKSASQQPGVRIRGGGTQPPPQSKSSGTLKPAQSKSTGVQAFYDVNRFSPDCHCAKQPFFSLKSGELSPGTQVMIESPSPTATIYYTTDGWTPTEASTRYIGPITVRANTTLQAIAEEPQILPSPVVDVTFTVDGPATPLQKDALAIGNVLVKGMPIRFATGSRVTSQTANVGDRVYLLLDQNVVVNGNTVAPRGMSVDAKIIRAERAGNGGRSGVIAFQIQTLNVHGTPVPLTGVFTLVAPDIAAQTQRISNPSMVRVSGPLPPGNEALIEPGRTLVAAVAADTTISQ